MCNCASCSRTVTPTGAKGNPGSFSGREEIISSSSSSQTLTPAQSGSVIFPKRAAGIDYQLPASEVGLTYEFRVLTDVTSNDYSVGVTGADIYTGFVYKAKLGEIPTISLPNGTTNNVISMNGSTTGGLVGTVIKVTCYEVGFWFVEGTTYGSGAVSTPFSG